jgi:hypothetical protein
MYVKLLEIENYKSFLKTQKIPLEPGFNLFVGANNSGKTSALEVLDLKTRIDVPHRSVANLPAYGDLPSPTSRLKITIETDLSEYRGIFKNSLFIPVPLVFENLDNYHGRNLGERFYTALLDYPAISITYEITDGIQWASYGTSYGCSGGVKIDNSLPIRAVNIKFNSPDGTIQESDISNFSGLGHYISNARDFYQSRIYRFSAQRLPADKSPTVGDPILQPDAGNLPYCINHLHSNDAEGHRILCDLVHRIFPSVKWIQAPPIPGNQTFQLQCLPEFPEARRNDLAVPMGRMGSGIGNVIAILYVVLTARFPQVIAIDEPNSFLHPKALRELLGILAREGKQHQYILTAHSPDVLTAVRPATITMFELNDTFTVTKQVSGKDLPLLRTELAELGIRMTDLHGRDRVLWVEGQTEEIVMPDLLQFFCPEVSAGTAVLRVEHTGAFEKKGISPAEVAKIYQRLTESSALVPPMVAILLDKESRSPTECAQISQESSRKMNFLERRMLENYVLHPGAISAILSEMGENVSVDIVREKLSLITGEGDPELHGADILRNLFSDLSETKLEFRKTRDTPLLFRWILENDPEALAELGDFLRHLFSLSCEEGPKKRKPLKLLENGSIF